MDMGLWQEPAKKLACQKGYVLILIVMDMGLWLSMFIAYHAVDKES